MEKESKNTLSVVVITKNEEKEIGECLKNLKFADEIIVIDSESTDSTVKLAKQEGAKVTVKPFHDFASQRNLGLKLVKSTWILYIDADEQVSKNLAEEILSAIISDEFDSYEIPRKNFYFKKYAWPKIEKMQRLFRKSEFLEWYGEVHESPRTKTNKIGQLKNPILHYSHKDLDSMVEKTNKWSQVESKLLLSANHPQMRQWRFIRIMVTKFIDSYFMQGGWRAGTAGLIESVYQSYSYFIVYAKLWEHQKNTNGNH